MNKDPRVQVAFILECIENIENYLRGVEQDDFMASSQLQDAVIRRIELIGEAAKNIPSSVKENYPKIPWKRMAGMRDILVHDYLGVDLKVTWRVAQKEIPELKDRIAEVNVDLGGPITDKEKPQP